MIVFCTFMTPGFRIHLKPKVNVHVYWNCRLNCHLLLRACAWILLGTCTALSKFLRVQEYFSWLGKLKSVPEQSDVQVNDFSLSEFVLVTSEIQNRSFFSSPLTICTY